jgi:hypothetical protein
MATTLLASALVVSMPAAAAAPPTAAALTWTGDDPEGVDACMFAPCRGATPGHPWSFSATTGGLALNDVVTFSFKSTITDGLHAVAMPVTLDTASIDVNLTGTLANCYTIVDNLPTHPASVTVDWANQTFSFPMPGAVTAGQTAQFCFTDGMAIGMPLTPSGDTTPYSLMYTEPGGSVSANYTVLDRRADPVSSGQEIAPPYINITNAAAVDVSNAGEAGVPAGFTNTTYNIALHGTPNLAYVLFADSGKNETGLSLHILDPRVTITCPATCTTDASGNLAATFTVSTGPLDHFVVVADCPQIESACLIGDTGVTAFTATNAPVAEAAPAAIKPALPRAGSALRPTPTWAVLVELAVLVLVCGAAAWRVTRRWGTDSD